MFPEYWWNIRVLVEHQMNSPQHAREPPIIPPIFCGISIFRRNVEFSVTKCIDRFCVWVISCPNRERAQDWCS